MGAALDYYYNKSKIWLPMGAEQHDPSNPGAARTLDVSGNGNHGTLGNGVTSTTFPTKLQKRGYAFDGGDYIDCGDVAFLNNTSAFTLNMAVADKDLTLQEFYIQKQVDTSNRILIWIIPAVPALYLYLRNAETSSAALAATKLTGRSLENITTVFNGSGATNADRVKVYVNGTSQPLTFVGTIQATMADLSGAPLLIGGTTPYHITSLMRSFQAWDIALTAPQVADLHTRLLAEVNHV